MATHTRTVMFTDLANYTAEVSRSDRAALRALLERHEEIVAPVVTRNEGVVVKNLGDSFMCLFGAATDGLRAALEIQDITKAGSMLSIRCALATGDVEEISGDAFGDAVNLAARILSKTPAGQVWFGPATKLCMNAAEVPWEAVGRHRFKGIVEERDVFRAVPAHRCWLPEVVVAATKASRLVRVRRGVPPPSPLPPDPVILLEGFVPGSPELAGALAALPVLEPAALWLGAWQMPPAERAGWVEAGRGLVVGTPAAIDQAILETLKASIRTTGSDTILIEPTLDGDFVVALSGLALPEVPLAEVVSGYAYDLVADGRWVNHSESALVRVDVGSEGVRLVVTSPGVRVGGRMCAADEVVLLRDGDLVETAAGAHRFRALDQGFAGALIADTSLRLGVVAGQVAEVGREPHHPGLALPDRRGQTNLRWCAGLRASKARQGGFTLDRALAGRQQASFQLHNDTLILTPLHERCPTFVLRSGAKQLERVSEPTVVAFGDDVVVGTSVVGVRSPELL